MPAAGLAFRVILSHYCPGLVCLAGFGLLLPDLGVWLGLGHVPPSVFDLIEKLAGASAAVKGLVAFLPIPFGVAIDEVHHYLIDEWIEECAKDKARPRPKNVDETVFRRIGPEHARMVLDEYWYPYEFDINMGLASVLLLLMGLIWAFHHGSTFLATFAILCCASALLFGKLALNARRYYLEALAAFDEGAGRHEKPERKNP